jgi:hypothetical protein
MVPALPGDDGVLVDCLEQLAINITLIARTATPIAFI